MTTAEKLKNFWYYHKFHVLAGVLALLFVLLTISECMKNKVPDISIGYISGEYRDNLKLEEEFEKVIDDLNDDGEIYTFCDSVILPDVPQNDGDMMLVQKVSVMFASGDYDMFIMDKDYFTADIYGDMFVDLSDIAPEEMKSDAVLMRGKPVAIKTSHSKFLNDLSFSDDELYVGFCALRLGDEENEKRAERHNELKEVFENIILK